VRRDAIANGSGTARGDAGGGEDGERGNGGGTSGARTTDRKRSRWTNKRTVTDKHCSGMAEPRVVTFYFLFSLLFIIFLLVFFFFFWRSEC